MDLDVKIEETLSQITHDLRCIPNLNCGGCCLVAYHMAKHLKKYKRVAIKVCDSRYIVEDDDGQRKTLPHGLGNVFNYYAVGIQFAHVYLRMKLEGQEITWDSDGIDWYGEIPFSSCIEFKGSLKLKDAKDLSAPEGWNYMFDRDKYEGNVIETIDFYFNELEKALKAPRSNLKEKLDSYSSEG